jgi:hypothetical protein
MGVWRIVDAVVIGTLSGATIKGLPSLVVVAVGQVADRLVVVLSRSGRIRTGCLCSVSVV